MTLEWLSRQARRLPPSRTKSRAGRVAAFLITRFGGRAEVPVRVEPGSFLLDARSRTESGMLWNGEHDSNDVAFLGAVTPPDGTFVDIGANVGLICIQVARFLGPDALVLAVEPEPINRERLNRGLELNDFRCEVRVEEVALGRDQGSVKLVKEGPVASSGNAIPWLDSPRGVRVEMTTLDALVGAHRLERIDTIKIDVEGFEVDVFRGATETLKKFRPLVYGEFNNQLMPQRGVDFTDAWKIFESHGYECFSFIGRLKLVRRKDPPANLGNVALVPAERVSRLASLGVEIQGD